MSHFTNIMANQSITSLISYMILALIIVVCALYYDIPRYTHLFSKDYNHYLNHQRQIVTKQFNLEGPHADALIKELAIGRLAKRTGWMFMWFFLAALQLQPHNTLDTLLTLFIILWLLAIYVRSISWPTPIDPDRKFKPLAITLDVLLEIGAYVCLIWSFLGALGAIIILVHMM